MTDVMPIMAAGAAPHTESLPPTAISTQPLPQTTTTTITIRRRTPQHR